MTAEIAVMNRQGVALAADSAVTIETSEGGRKAWQSANKIFGMSPRHPVGLMIYGSAEILGVPWDTVVKSYRDTLGSRAFGTIGEYADDFVKYLGSHRGYFPAELQRAWFRGIVGSDFRGLFARIRRQLEEEFSGGAEVTEADIRRVSGEVVSAAVARLEGLDELPHVTSAEAARMERTYGADVTDLRKEVFQKLPMTAATSRKLRRFAFLLFQKEAMSQGYTGVVIAGFGEDQHFPALEELAVEGVLCNRLNYVRADSSVIGPDGNSIVRAFAQKEMVIQFMEGVDQQYQEVVEELIDGIAHQFPEAIVENIPRLGKKRREDLKAAMASAADQVSEAFRAGLNEVRRERYVMPIVRVVSVLPKDELAAMAEALVNLTAVRRRLSFQVESVGGPIDVALISKGDGFVWIKRKNYFDLALNPHFQARYARSGEE